MQWYTTAWAWAWTESMHHCCYARWGRLLLPSAAYCYELELRSRSVLLEGDPELEEMPFSSLIKKSEGKEKYGVVWTSDGHWIRGIAGELLALKASYTSSLRPHTPVPVTQRVGSEGLPVNCSRLRPHTLVLLAHICRCIDPRESVRFSVKRPPSGDLGRGTIGPTLRWENRPGNRPTRRETGLEMPCLPSNDLLWVQITQSYPNRLRFWRLPSPESPCHTLIDPIFQKFFGKR